MEVANNSHYQQAMASHQMTEVLPTPKIQQEQEKKPRPPTDQPLKCPRCDSANTKFCYYNNYSLSQPRYFCKGCRRYWTQGGSLRNVPVGGGCRKNKRSSLSSSSNATAKPKPAADHQTLINTTTPPSNPNTVMLHSMIAPPQLPSLSFGTNDLTLAFAGLQNNQHGYDDHHGILLGHANNNSAELNVPTYGFLDILKSSGATTTSGMNNLYYGFGSEEQGNSCKEMDEGETKMLMGLQWPENNLSLDNNGRDYWSGGSVVGSSANWHGLINSSLI